MSRIRSGFFETLQAVADVEKTAPSDGDILKWDAALGMWILTPVGVFYDAVYLGDPSTNGSWKIVIDGNNLSFKRREAGSWVEKGAMQP